MKAIEALKKPDHKRGTKTNARPVFDSIRKPLPPPGHTLGHAKPEERARPSQRKAKHKRRPESTSDE